MTQNQHSMIAFILMMVTTQIYYYFYPRLEEEEFWEKWFKDKFNL